LNKLEICVFIIAAIAIAALTRFNALTIARHATQRAAVMEIRLYACHFAPLIRLRHMALCKLVLID